MSELDTEIRAFVANDKLEDAAKRLGDELGAQDGDLRDEIVTLRAELTRIKRENRRRQLSHTDYNDARRRISFTLLEILDSASEVIVASAPVTVFLSYNHADAGVAQTLKQGLESHRLSVVIDSEAMQPGEDIRQFIGRSIRESDATVCVISEASLMSGWVALETVLALADAEVNERRRFVACYLDDCFMAADFQLTATTSIDDRVRELDVLRQKHTEQGTLAPALDDERTRLLDLRHHLGRIIQHLLGALSLDIRPPAIGSSIDGLAASLTRSEP
jgi:hypothetical protein